jgi:CheY-like chemotaxis protein
VVRVGAPGRTIAAVKNDQLDAQTAARLFKRAQAIKGGAENLARALGIQPQQLAPWTSAKAFPPQDIFEKVLEIILDAQEASVADANTRPASASDAGAVTSASKPRALVAESSKGFAVIADVLGEFLDLVPVHWESDALDLVQASAAVGGGIDLIICGQHFEGSQMLDFLQCVKAYKPTSHIPFICCRVMPTRLSDSALAAMRDACELLGALAFVDLVGTERAEGAEAAVMEFRDAVRTAVALRKDVVNLRVLVVDDNADAAHTLAALLGMAGHVVLKAASGAEALRIAEQFRPSVVVLDIAMPGMSGYEVAERLRAAPWGKDLTLIAMTAYSAAQMRPGTESAFDHHFVKPVDLQQLLSAFPKKDAPDPLAQ